MDMYYVQIVDDEPIMRMGLSQMIDWHELGFEIAALAQNGKQALEQQEIEKVDVIITDIQMPIMDGLKFIAQVRAEESQHQHLPKKIVVLTAYDDFDYAKTAIRYGASAYLLKPTDKEELSETMRQIKKELDENKAKMNP